MLTPHHLDLPPDYELLAGADSGTYCSGLIVALSPSPYECLVLEEFPNYRYVGGEIELLGLSIGEWAWTFTQAWKRYAPHRRLKPWIDANTQFAAEYAHQGIYVQRNPKAAELRVEITREYFQHGKVWLAPWLDILPYELENAKWPDDVNSAGRYMRVKESDHTLDCLEHPLSRRPRSQRLKATTAETFLERYLAQHRRPGSRPTDPHLGRMG